LMTDSKISEQNRKMISDFQGFLFSKQSSPKRVAKLTSQLRKVCYAMTELKIDKDFNDLSRQDLVNVVAYWNTKEGIADATKADYRRAIKQFYLWFKDDDKRLYCNDSEVRNEARKFYQYLEKEVKESYKEKQVDPLSIISDAEIDIVIEKGAKTAKEKAFISLLHETGCRAAEFLNLKVGNVILKQNFAEIHIPDGKTGRRTVFVVKSIPYLLSYLDCHAAKQNPNALLWLGENRALMDQPLMYNGAVKLVCRCFERAGFIDIERTVVQLENGKTKTRIIRKEVKKQHNLHWFRHSRATLLAPKMTEAMLCKYMGWTIGSKQVRRYAHLCVKQLEDVFLSIHGLQEKDERTDLPIKCICGIVNPAKQRYCNSCHRPLTMDTVIQDKETVDLEINKTMQFFMEMSKKPEMMKDFQDFLKKKAKNKKA